MTIISDLYNRVLNFFNNEKEDENSKNTACNRLKLVLMQDRAKLDPAIMEQLRQEMIEVISKYIEIDTEALGLNLAAEGDTCALMLNIPVIRAKTIEEIEEANKILNAKIDTDDDDDDDDDENDGEQEQESEENNSEDFDETSEPDELLEKDNTDIEDENDNEVEINNVEKTEPISTDESVKQQSKKSDDSIINELPDSNISSENHSLKNHDKTKQKTKDIK